MSASPFDAVARVADALLHEGWVLYPYRPDALKNRHRWTLGGLLPEGWASPGEGPTSAVARLLVRGPGTARLVARVRFLQLLERTREGESAPASEALPRDYDPPAWSLAELAARPRAHAFAFPATDSREGDVRRASAGLAGTVELAAEELAPSVHRITARVLNRTSLARGLSRRDAELRSLASLHVLAHVVGGQLVSLQDPPDDLRELAAATRGEGLWPALLGGRGDVVLAAPIVVADHPELAPESPGDFFDATEIDELLSLRLLTLTDAEKAAVRAGDPRARGLLERTEALGLEGLRALHGRLSGPLAPPEDGGLVPGMRVRLRPRGRADAFDVLLAGRLATVRSLEQTLEGETMVAVTVDDDPGQDLGVARQVGHRFFFRLDEVEPPGREAAA